MEDCKIKVKCKKFLSPFGDGEELEICSFLTKGKVYILLGMSFCHHRLFFIEDDEGQMIGVDIRQFDILSDYLPSRWMVENKAAQNYLSFFPKSWVAAENFWDRLQDDNDPEMVELYRMERDLIYQEEPEP